jgi:hypothetical protein
MLKVGAKSPIHRWGSTLTSMMTPTEIEAWFEILRLYSR